MKPHTARLLLVAWVAVLVAILVPWGDITDHTHWRKVTWIPFAPRLRPFDIAANVLLFVPYGVLWRRARFETRWMGRPTAVLSATVLSVGAEAVQLYSHWRFPSATDVVTNVVGVLVGLRW